MLWKTAQAAESVYLHVGLLAGASHALAALAVRTLGLEARVAVAVLGGLAVGIYYWFSTPVLVESYGIPEAATVAGPCHLPGGHLPVAVARPRPRPRTTGLGASSRPYSEPSR